MPEVCEFRLPPEPRDRTASGGRILLIEDDHRLVDLLRRGLSEQGFHVLTATDGDTGLNLARNCLFDVLVLDLGLPGIDGYEICAILRRERISAGILMLTARDSEDNVVLGFDMGADEYLRKPFSFRELVARIRTVSQRVDRNSEGSLRFTDLELDCRLRRCFCAELPVHLSAREFTLLEALTREAGRCISRKNLTRYIWGDEPVSHGALDSLVASLRIRLDRPDAQTVILTVRGSGYQLVRKGGEGLPSK
jgi:DNA-binding response OmpR family regulator